jgi:Uncharacterized conserved protein
MSDAIFPTLKGLAIGIKKKPAFLTLQQTSVLGVDKGLSLRPYPWWTFTLAYDYLVDKSLATDDIQQIIGFYLNRYGKYDDFLYYDLYDNTCAKQAFGEGDGSTTTFPLCRSYGSFIEPVIGIADAPTIYIDGVATTDFTWTTKGKITFATAPASGAGLTWSGSFYYRCRFVDDETEFEEVVNSIWSAPTVLFKSVLI